MSRQPITIPLAPLFNLPVPQDAAAEAAVVGAMITEPSTIPDIRRTLSAEDFYTPRLIETFTAANEIYIRTRTLDIALLVSELNTGPGFDADGCIGFLTATIESCPSWGTWPHYAERVKAKSKARRLVGVCAEAVHAAYQASEDISGVVAQHFERVAHIARNDSQAAIIQLVDAADEVIAMMEEGRPLNLRTGIDAFDDISGGVPKSGVWAIFAPPSTGKTTFALRACLNIARGLPARGEHPAQEKRVVRYCSVEQPAIRAAATLLSQDTGRSVHELISNFKATPAQIDETVEARLSWGLPEFGFFRESKDPNQLFAECLALSTKHEHGVLVMDYIQDTPPFDKFVDLTPRITEGMRILSRIARELGWLVIVVSQIDKASSKLNQSPKLTDGIGSSAIEQRSDVISYVWRPHQREVPPPYSRDTFTGEDDPTWAAWNARNKRVRVGVIKSKYGNCGVADMMYTGRSMNFIDPPPEVAAQWNTIEEH